MLVHDRKAGQQNDFNSQVEANEVSMGGKVRLGVDAAPDYDLLRDTFMAHRKQSQLLRGLDVDDDELLDDWYCSEEFAQLLTDHFHRAVGSAIQES